MRCSAGGVAAEQPTGISGRSAMLAQHARESSPAHGLRHPVADRAPSRLRRRAAAFESPGGARPAAEGPRHGTRPRLLEAAGRTGPPRGPAPEATRGISRPGGAHGAAPRQPTNSATCARSQPPTAVSVAVELVKSAGKTSAGGLVNAVLRRLPPAPPPQEAARLCHPIWLVQRWEAALGRATCRSLLAANLRQPATYLRLQRDAGAAPARRRLAQAGVSAVPTDLPRAYRVESGSLAGLPAGHREDWAVQDLNSQRVAALVKPLPGAPILDLCAAPGGKARILAETAPRGSRRPAPAPPTQTPAPGSSGPAPGGARRRPAASVRSPLRPHPDRCALLRDWHTGSQPGHQMEAPSGRPAGPARPAGRHSGPRAGGAGSGRKPRLLHLLPGTGGKRTCGGSRPRGAAGLERSASPLDRPRPGSGGWLPGLAHSAAELMAPRDGWTVTAVAAAVFLGTISSPPALLDDVDAAYAQIARTMLEVWRLGDGPAQRRPVFRQTTGASVGHRGVLRRSSA